MSEAHAISGRLTPAGHELVQRVYFEDTDFSGRVYHARYLHFMERGRSDYLRLLGIHHGELAKDGLAFAVRRMEIDFIRPAAIDDVLTIFTAPETIAGARIVLAQEIRRDAERLVAAQCHRGAGRAGRPPDAAAGCKSGRCSAPGLSPDKLTANGAIGAIGATAASAVETTMKVASANVAAIIVSSLQLIRTIPCGAAPATRSNAL